MYSDKQKSPWPRIVFAILALFAVLFTGRILYQGGAEAGEESITAIREAVERGAKQCYVVEGIYPPSLDYLQENYGLQVNTRDFYITYDAIGSNVPPYVKVTAKQKKGQ